VNRRSIRFRLTALYSAILAATLCAVAIGAWFAIRDSINDTVDKELRSRLGSMREYVAREGVPEEGSASLDELAENEAFTPAGTHFRIAGANSRWLYQSHGTAAWGTPPAAASLPARGRASTISANGEPVRVLTAPLAPGLVQIGINLDEFGELLRGFTWTSLLASPVLLLLSSAGGYWMSRRALAPVEEIASTANEIQLQRLSSRLPLRGTGDELDHLSEVLNAMLARLEESFQRITQFTADASHELRTPVAIIRTAAEVTRRKPRTEQEYAEALDRILAESERTTELIEDLMVLARGDAQSEPSVLQTVHLRETVCAAAAEMRWVVESAGLVLIADPIAECDVSGDEPELRRLVLILLDNAVKYSRSGGEIRLRLDVVADAGRRRAVVEVRDNGIGIGAEDLPHVFERFYRASKDRSRKVAGVGLGLSIAQSIVRRHGGELQVQSTPGEGSAFRIILPAP
jgi:two-component system, OmpR family, heavy metal sensor histidine kinase CusS